MSTGRIAVLITIAVLAALIVIIAVSRIARKTPEEEPRPDLGRRLERLRSLPYATVTPDTVEPAAAGVVVYEAERAWPGYNLYCSGLKPEAYLMNMSGDIVHTWSYPEITPWRWRAVEMLDNGDLLVVNKLNALMKLDWHSNLVWSRPMLVHHDVTPLENGTLYALTTAITKYRDVMVKFDAILRLNSLGEETERWWSYDHLDEIRLAFDQSSFLDGILDSVQAGGDLDPEESGAHIYDYFHLNTVNLLPPTPLGENDARFRAGNLLLCFRNINQIAVMDADSREILWTWGEGELEWPHYPVMLESGNILVYDNGVFRKHSRIIEVNPATDEIEWEYMGNPPETFYNETRGAAQRLANGNTLICDSGSGRAFEVTSRGETVWQWLNPVTEEGHRVQVVRIYRIPPETVEPLLAH